MSLKTVSSILLLFTLAKHAQTQDIPFSPCPILGPRFPIPTTLTTSPIFQSGVRNLTQTLDAYVANLNGTFGPIFPSTSFSITLFSTEETNSTDPFLYEYHHTAPSFANGTLGLEEVDADTVYQIGDLTTLFTTWLFLIEAGEQHWADPVSRWLPELAAAARGKMSGFAVDWNTVTLGDLAAHLGGIGRYALSGNNNSSGIAALLALNNATDPSPCEEGLASCDRAAFLSYFGARNAVYAPGSTPIFSNAGFIILGYALERITGQPYAALLDRAITHPLNLTRTAHPDASALQAPFTGLSTTPSDLTRALRALLRSSLLPESTTRRWLKPTSHTSNLVNSVGRPWEIFSLAATPISPVIPVYQVRGSAGTFAAHIGVVPDYGTGFVILARDDGDIGSLDLNAHADVLASEVVPALEKAAIAQASAAFAGTYSAKGNVSLTIARADGSPGLSVSRFQAGDTDVRAAYASLNGIAGEGFSFRLYPSDVSAEARQQVYRASFKDMSALADAGTPTCETWRYIDQFQIRGVSVDEFVFEMESGEAVGVVIPAFGTGMLKRQTEGDERAA
jgi:CubicO group peptidase (beta-lactamase class C family)